MYPLISVIVPIYGIERYIGFCIQSIVNQTYKNLEIILVDDGGKDRCPEICDLYGEKDKRIKVIHKSNGGLVSARKAGLQESNGVYISYVDGDDWIAPDFIESLYDAISAVDAEIVCAGQSRDLFMKSVEFYNTIPVGVYEGDKLKKLWEKMISYDNFYRPDIMTYVWNKMFKRDLLLSAQMKVEDGAVTYPALLECKKVVVMENTAYHYRQREDSMLKQNTSFFNEAKKLRYLYDFLWLWAGNDANLQKQIIDYVLSIAIMRSGGRLSHDTYSTFDKDYYDKNVVVYSAGTFGQQLVNRFRESGHCNVVAWLDDDYWEYRRCCLNVDPVERITSLSFEYVLIATVDTEVEEKIIRRLKNLGVEKCKILTVTVPKEREKLLKQFLDLDTLSLEELKKNKRLFRMFDFATKILTAPIGKTYLFSVGQAGFIIKSANGQLLGIDMYLSDCVERIEGHKGYKRMLPKILGFEEIKFDVIVTTHFHKDHFDDDAVPAVLANGAQLYAAYDCENDVKRLGLGYYKPIFVSPGDEYEYGAFHFRFVECDHGTDAPLAVGVVVTVDGKTIYEAGDTCLRMDRVDGLGGPFDVVIGPINGVCGNMNEVEFPQFAHAIGGLIIPCHYGMFPSHGGDLRLFYEEMKNIYPDDRYLIMSQGECLTL